MRRICVYCGSSSGNSPRFAEAATAMGRAIAGAGIELVYGGGRAGLMGVIADAALEAGGRVIGVMPTAVLPRELVHPRLTEFYEVSSFAERIARFHALSDAFVALPGGIGTLEELFEALSRAQLGQHEKPCALLDVDGYYEPLLALLDRALAAGFIRDDHRKLLFVSRESGELLERLLRHDPKDRAVAAKWASTKRDP